MSTARHTATATVGVHPGEVDADDPRRANLRPGGKSLSGDGTSPVLQVRVSAELREQIRAAAVAAGMSPSRYARRVLEQHFDAERDTP